MISVLPCFPVFFSIFRSSIPYFSDAHVLLLAICDSLPQHLGSRWLGRVGNTCPVPPSPSAELSTTLSASVGPPTLVYLGHLGEYPRLRSSADPQLSLFYSIVALFARF